jgi:hypothetical protein
MTRTSLTHLTRLVAALLVACAASAGAQLIAYDGFGNGPLANLHGSTGGSGWAAAWVNAGTNLTKVQGAGLSFPGLDTTPGAAVTPTAGGTWPSSTYQRNFALPADASAVYVSFLLRDDAAWGIWGGLSFGSYPYEMTVGSPLGYYQYGLMLSEGLGDLTSKPLVKGQTTLVVVKISKNTPAQGITYRMYLDPAIGSAEPGFPAAQMGVAFVPALPTSLSIDNGTGFTTDEIRVGTTWASVLPAKPTWTDLGFAKAGSAGTPVLSAFGPLSAGSFNQLDLVDALPSATATLVFGLSQVLAPFKGGTLVPEPSVLVPLALNASGGASLAFTLPPGVPSNTALHFQCWVADAGASHGLSATNGLKGVTP